MKKILSISLGCVKNQIDLEYLLGDLINEGFSLTDDFSNCDYILLNTCSFIEDARKEAEAFIKEFRKTGKLIVTGCYPQKEKDYFRSKFKDIKWVIGTESQRNSLQLIDALKTNNSLFVMNDNSLKYRECGIRFTFNSFHTYIKISEGCSRRCSFCSIPDIRGFFRSRKKQNIMNEIINLSQKGFKEFNLVSEDSSLYGREIYKNYILNDLVKDISKTFINSLFRLLYVFPDKTIYSTIDSIAESESFIKYIDIPFQHVSKRVLKNMGRVQENPVRVADYVKSKSLILRSSVMVGYPQETEKDFLELIGFIDKDYIDKLGIFMYSDEKGTPSCCMKNKVEERVKIERFNELIKVYRKRAKKKMLSNIDKIKKCVFTKRENGIFVGRMIEDAPSIDSILISDKKNIKLNELMNIKIIGVRNYTYIA